MPQNPPRRRWFQFGLRTMFAVVTVFAVWLGWQVRVVQQRRAMLHWFAEQHITAISATESAEYGDPAPQISFWRRWLGDESIVQIYGPEDKAAAAQAAFPEVEVFVPVPLDRLRPHFDGCLLAFKRYVPDERRPKIVTQIIPSPDVASKNPPRGEGE